MLAKEPRGIRLRGPSRAGGGSRARLWVQVVHHGHVLGSMAVMSCLHSKPSRVTLKLLHDRLTWMQTFSAAGSQSQVQFPPVARRPLSAPYSHRPVASQLLPTRGGSLPLWAGSGRPEQHRVPAPHVHPARVATRRIRDGDDKGFTSISNTVAVFSF